MWSKVKNYTDEQLWNKVLSIGGKYPKKLHLSFIAVQSNEDVLNRFDDKFYVYIGRGKNKMPKFLGVTSATTNTGKNGLFGAFKKYTKKGVFVWKTNMFYPDAYIGGYHKGKMKAFRLATNVYYYRDKNLDSKAEEQGELFIGNKHTNIHTVSYNPLINIVKKYINGWSLGCIVLNDTKWYYNFFIKNFWKEGIKADFTILKEW